MSQKINKIEHENVIKMYIELVPISAIADKYNVSNDTIRSIARKYNIPSQTRLFHTYNDENIVNMYQNGFSSKYIANYYKVDGNTIISALKKNGVSIKSANECHRKYSLNENYFDNIDTPDKAYFMGLLYADGYNDGNGHISISLQERDVDILNKFKKAIESNNPLNYRDFSKYSNNWSNQYRMFINSKHMSNVLLNYGMIPKKSEILEFPLWLNKSLYRDFIRGYWDGDGHIGKTYISVIGSIKFIEVIQEILENIFSCKTHIYNKGSMQSLHISRKDDFVKVLDYLYKDASVFLDRKYNSYLLHIA